MLLNAALRSLSLDLLNFFVEFSNLLLVLALFVVKIFDLTRESGHERFQFVAFHGLLLNASL